jgi:acid stress-induced BolA-like protein IbaG/YrbA
MTPAEIQALIESHLPDSSAQVTSGDHVHFEAIVICPAFAGQRRLQRHQMVYAALGERMREEIHALSIQALTPEELAQRGG